MSDLTWVEQVQTVLATDYTVVEAINNNPGWRLIATGVDPNGQTTLTYGWPWMSGFKSEPETVAQPCRITANDLPGSDELWCHTHQIAAESLDGCLAVIF